MRHWKSGFAGGWAVGMLVLGVACSQDPPACAGACAPQVPEGWVGPWAFWRGEFLKSGDAGPCAAEGWSFAEVGYPQPLEAEPLACKPCACAPAEGANAGKCVAQEVDVGPLEPHFPDFTRAAVFVCAAESKSGACASGAMCVPPPSAFEALCVYKRGDVPCEGAWAGGQRFTYYASFQDLRDCSPCGCEVAKVDPSAKDAGAKDDKDAGAKACGTPTGGQATGKVTMTDLTTACCR